MTESKTESETPLKLGKQTRNFHGKDIIVEVNNAPSQEKHVSICLSIEGIKFIAYEYGESAEMAYAEAIKFIEKDLAYVRTGNELRNAKSFLEKAQEAVFKAQRRKDAADLFYEFVGDKK